MKTFMQEINYEDIPEFFDEGLEGQVWIKDGYVYKLYRMDYDNPNKLSKRLDALNSLPEYEREELVAYIKTKYGYKFITKLKKLKDWQELLAEFYFSHNRRLKDWNKIVEQFIKDSGYVKKLGGYCKNNIRVADIEFENMGMNDKGELKIIDAEVL